MYDVSSDSSVFLIVVVLTVHFFLQFRDSETANVTIQSFAFTIIKHFKTLMFFALNSTFLALVNLCVFPSPIFLGFCLEVIFILT